MLNIVRDVVYREVDGQRLLLDLFIPEDNQSAQGVVVYFHGGGFELGERSDREQQRAERLASLGIPVATVQYRFTDVAPFPAQLEDARAAVSWLREHSSKFGFSADRVGAWGASAGGHLAALLGLGVPADGRAPDVEAAVVWFGGLDLDALSRGTRLERELLGDGGLDAFLGGPFDPRNEIHVRADPLHQVSVGASPLLLMSGDRDRIIDISHSQRLHDSLVVAGADSSLWIIGGAGHEDDAFESPVVISALAGFFSHHLNPQV